MEFTITSDQIIGFCALVTALWGFWKIAKEIKQPSSDLKETVQKHTELLANDNRRLKELETSNRMTLQCLLVLIDHNITGNSIEKMKDTRNKLQEYLIEK